MEATVHTGITRNVQTARPCFYADFMKCQPLNFKGTEGVVGLTRWIKKMESVFNISGCAIESQVKFATCTILLPTKPRRLTSTSVDFLTTFMGTSNLPDPRRWMRLLSWPIDIMDQKLCTYAEGNLDNKRKADDSSRNNHGHQQQPFKSEFRQGLQYGDRRKEALWGSFPSAPSAIFTTMARAPRSATSATK
ncbi:hypothetical protein Tco_0128477 [Tanacetum coccineum]